MTWRLALLLAIATRVWACMCGGPWPSVKQAWQEAPFVFLGTVVLADPDDDSSQATFQTQFVRVRVDEAFKGVSEGQTIELHQGSTDCHAKFRSGQRFVFFLYAGRTPGSWHVPLCTHALGSADPAGDDLLFLRGLPESAIGTRLSGEVEFYDPFAAQATRQFVGVPNVKVTITGPAGFTREMLTNSAGTYEVYGLPPGRYTVRVEAPKGFVTFSPLIRGSADVQGDPAALEITADGGVSADFMLRADTRLSGRVLDANAAPLQHVCFSLKPLLGGGENGSGGFDCSEADGAYAMELIPPGEYRLVAWDEVQMGSHQSESTLYHPGVRERERATVFAIKPGDHLEDVDIRLPSDEKRWRIAGRIQFADGAPVPRGGVRFTSQEHGYSATTSTGPDGSFVLPVIAGMEGQLSGGFAVLEPMLKSCPQFEVGQRRGLARVIEATPLALTSDSDQENITLELPSPSCEFWPPSRE